VEVSFQGSGLGPGGNGTWDFKLSKQAIVRTTFEIAVNEEDGSVGRHTPGSRVPMGRVIREAMRTGQRMNVLFEVKTIGRSTDGQELVDQVARGFTQAIQNALLNPTTTTDAYVSILILDEDVYKRAYNLAPERLGTLYKQLQEAGGGIRLHKGHSAKAWRETREILFDDIRKNTTNEQAN
jgi:hypothetical protein